MTERKITSEQIEKIKNMILGSSYNETGCRKVEKELRKIFPDYFKPKQEFCCDTFRKAVESKHGGIYSVKIVGENGGIAWISDTGWFQEYCFSCGQETIKPIKLKE